MTSPAPAGPATPVALPDAAPPTRRRRGPLLGAAVVLVGVGLTVSASGTGRVADALGDALYAALVWVVLALVAPRWRTTTVTVAAVAVCAAVELAQLTGLPAAATAAWPPARYLLGTTFAAPDLAAYAAGAVAAGAVASRVVRPKGDAR